MPRTLKDKTRGRASGGPTHVNCDVSSQKPDILFLVETIRRIGSEMSKSVSAAENF